MTKGSLARLYQKYELRNSQVSAYIRQILSGLNYLHERKVVHRDINCANILVDANGFVKLADFRLAKATALNDIKSCKETPYLMAPEIIFIFLNLLSDCIVYRLGMLLFSSIIIYCTTHRAGSSFLSGY
ncbi:putative mitogen-activated protein kinase kinase kinase STE-STE11 family [Helianthus annuus]|uniref:Mitogen-activated protein kinase kinase kinase STE-STE11 family n=2 Tax=Helianthus annuus TaxID=4232 RepID=A0A9K3IH76_HELAN|nr:putative mitogen-activated protein kinase kinase kinase STE-STE11 family [Helianthus annuus]KAJ0540034.1 putative mitogen-activated protein kinase kinase kinase STE-STE11 family [Helianthus annuus]KAJ0554774.1 putative mitogen-activated protein kinase kinase kinase STE-STE11 family [Helianthus annuus]KAJ0720342.1 putative mitogen-activated protein kinase kinase kinase STE-STE11 family [Helianthus annuus]KAJ0723555.1 putative mitogen-activated protein kinase kinase kinase STE-STE11 family [He